MRGWIYSGWLLALSCWAPLAFSQPAASGAAAASAAPAATPATPEEDFAAADNADKGDDMITSAKLYKRAADGGHLEAQVRFAHILFQSSETKGALEYFRKAADKGYAGGQHGMGLMYEGGQGGLTQDFAEARKWHVMAAQQGFVLSINRLADACIGHDEIGLLKIYSRQQTDKMIADAAVLCGNDPYATIKRAADLDYVKGIQALAEAYRSGKYGVTPDAKQAAELTARANKLLGIVEKKEKKKRRM
jgi:TPR repeat protein